MSGAVLFDSLLCRLNARLGEAGGDYAKYRQDPVGFMQNVLGLILTDQQKRFCEAVRDHQTVVGQSSNAVGKSFIVAAICIWVYKCFDGVQIYTLAAPPESNLRKIVWAHLNANFEKLPELFKNDTRKDLLIQRNPLEFIAGITIPTSGSDQEREAKVSGKHSRVLVFILDEADAIPDAVFRGIESCASGGEVRIICTYNPRQPSGSVYRLVRDGKAHVLRLSAFDHENVITGENRFPGAVTRAVVVRRICEWCRPLAGQEKPDADCFELPAYLEGEVGVGQSGELYQPLKAGWYKITNPSFAYMVLGQYPSAGSNQLIAQEWINRARSRWDAHIHAQGETPPALTRPVGGLDPSEYGSDETALIFRWGGYVGKPIVWSGMDPTETARRAAEHAKERSATRLFIDSIGIGSALPSLVSAAGMPGVSVKASERATAKSEIGEFNRLRDQLFWSLREWLRVDPGAALPPDETLLEELQVITYEIDAGKIKIMSKDNIRELLGRSCDRADALCLTFASSGFFGGCSFPTF